MKLSKLTTLRFTIAMCHWGKTCQRVYGTKYKRHPHFRDVEKNSTVSLTIEYARNFPQTTNLQSTEIKAGTDGVGLMAQQDTPLLGMSASPTGGPGFKSRFQL